MIGEGEHTTVWWKLLQSQRDQPSYSVCVVFILVIKHCGEVGMNGNTCSTFFFFVAFAYSIFFKHLSCLHATLFFTERGYTWVDIRGALVFPKTLYFFPVLYMNFSDYYLHLSCFLIAFPPTNTFWLVTLVGRDQIGLLHQVWFYSLGLMRIT